MPKFVNKISVTMYEYSLSSGEIEIEKEPRIKSVKQLITHRVWQIERFILHSAFIVRSLKGIFLNSLRYLLSKLFDRNFNYLSIHYTINRVLKCTTKKNNWSAYNKQWIAKDVNSTDFHNGCLVSFSFVFHFSFDCMFVCGKQYFNF